MSIRSGSGTRLTRSTSTPSDLSTGETLTIWVNNQEVSGAGDRAIIFVQCNNGHNVEVYFRWGTGISVWDGSNDHNGSTILVTGTWTHIAIVFNGSGISGSIEVFVNASSNLTGTLSGGDVAVTPGGAFNLIARNGGGDELDCIASYSKHWSRALSAADIAAEYAAGPPVSTTAIDSYLRMANAATAGTDSSGNGLDWTVVGTFTDGASEASFTPSGAMSGTAAATTTATATLVGAGSLSGSTAASAAASATLKGAGALVAAVSGSAAASGTLAGAAALAGTAAASASATATLTGSGALAGTSAATSAASGTLSGAGALAGSAPATAAATGSLSGAGALSGSAGATSSASATLGGTGSLVGSAAASAAATGTLTAAQPGGTATAVCTATGTLTGAGALAGTATAQASATGHLTATGGAIPVMSRGMPGVSRRPVGLGRTSRRRAL